MKKLKLKRIHGKIYNVLGLYGGNIYLGNPYDVNNDVIKKGVIWEMQPFHKDVPMTKILYFYLIRYFKKDVFGNSDFKKKLSDIKLLLNKKINLSIFFFTW